LLHWGVEEGERLAGDDSRLRVRDAVGSAALGKRTAIVAKITCWARLHDSEPRLLQR